MVFSSAIFLFYFLPLVLIFYTLTHGKLLLQNLVLFLASFVFYFWGEKQYIVLVLASVFFNYVMGYAIDKIVNPLRVIILSFSIVVNLLILLYYKYFGFLVSNLEYLLGRDFQFGDVTNIHLPLGISFFTFHGLTYVIDIYRKDANASHNPLNVGLYTLFFPQLVAGPIVRYKDIDQQLSDRRLSGEDFYIGVKRFMIGFSKKLLIANTAGEIADRIYGLSPEYQHASILWLAAVSYSLQIYFDFSGYSDMAIGLARMFGFRFLENFNFPYTATSIQDFWRRWHISLSTFFRDYVYIPLGGNRKGRVRTYINLLIVFFLTGVWHGASWNFIIWGMFHGSFLICERAGLGMVLDRIPIVFRRFYTIMMVLVGWVIFRIEDFSALATILKKMFLVDGTFKQGFNCSFFLNTYNGLILIAGILFSVPIVQIFRKRFTINTNNTIIKLGYDFCFVILFFIGLSIMASSTFNPFIYFRF